MLHTPLQLCHFACAHCLCHYQYKLSHLYHLTGTIHSWLMSPCMCTYIKSKWDRQIEREEEREFKKKVQREESAEIERKWERAQVRVGGWEGGTLPSDVAGNMASTGSASSSVTHSKLQVLQAAQWIIVHHLERLSPSPPGPRRIRSAG